MLNMLIIHFRGRIIITALLREYDKPRK